MKFFRLKLLTPSDCVYIELFVNIDSTMFFLQYQTISCMTSFKVLLSVGATNPQPLSMCIIYISKSDKLFYLVLSEL